MTNRDLFTTILSPLDNSQKADALLLLLQDGNKDFHTVTKTYQAAIELRKHWDQMNLDERSQVLDSLV